MGYSTFTPENGWEIDTFIELFDFSGSDIKNVKRYQELKLKETLTSAEETELANLLSPSGGNLIDKIMSVVEWNKRNETTVNMQRYFKENTVGIVDQCKQDLDTAFDTYIGKLGVKYTYSPSEIYEDPNLVTYNNGETTDLYLCHTKCPYAGILPTNTSYFIKLSLKGDKGENGSNMVWSGVFDLYTSYNLSALVYYNGGMYVSKHDVNQGNLPDVQDSEHWQFWQYQVPDGSIGLQHLNSSIAEAINSIGDIGNLLDSINGTVI